MEGITKGSMLQLVKESAGTAGIRINSIHRMLNVNPANEEDRKKVWRIGQCLAELVYARWVGMDIINGQRVYFKVSQ